MASRTAVLATGSRSTLSGLWRVVPMPGPPSRSSPARQTGLSPMLWLMPAATLMNPYQIGAIGAWSIKPLDIVTSLLIIQCCLQCIQSRRTLRCALPYITALVIYHLCIAVGPLVSDSHAFNWKFIGRYALVLAWGFIGICLVTTPRAFRQLAWSIAAAGSALGCISAYIYLGDASLQRIAAHFSAAGGQGLSSQASFNEVGAAHVLSICLLLPLLIGARRKLLKSVCVLLLALNLVGLVLTASRSSLLALGVVLMVTFSLVISRRLPQIAAALCTLAALYAVMTYLQARGFSGRVHETFDITNNAYRSMVDRFTWWGEGVRYFAAHPETWAVGIGPGTISTQIGAATTDSYWLDHLIGEGVCGVILLLRLLLHPLWTFFKKRQERLPALGGALAVIAVLVVSLTGNVVVDPMFGSIAYLVIYGCYRVISSPA